MTKAVLTLATGRPVYLELAATLARSFRVWNRESNIRFVLATDLSGLVPPDLDWVDVVTLQPGQYGHGFSPKLFLNEISPVDRTLFVDADCLCVGSMEYVFERFTGMPVSVIGRDISEGEWFGDVASICKSFDVPAIPRFNGGVYYFERGETSDAVFRTAQDLQSRYDDIGFVRLRESPNDEVLMALSMALHGQRPVPDDGTIMNSTLAAPGGVEVDVLKGVSRFRNPKSHPEHNSWYQMEEMRPVLAHFLGYQTTRYPYRREAIRLERVFASGWPPSLARLWTGATFSLPWLATNAAKDALRPVYHRLFGARPVRHSTADRV